MTAQYVISLYKIQYCIYIYYVLFKLPLLSKGIQVSLRKWILMYSPPPESVHSGDTPSSRQWDLVGVADSSQLGTPERTRELEKMKEKRTECGMTIVANLLNGKFFHAWVAAILRNQKHRELYTPSHLSS